MEISIAKPKREEERRKRERRRDKMRKRSDDGRFSLSFFCARALGRAPLGGGGEGVGGIRVMVTESKPKPSLPRLSIASNRADERRSARVDLMTDDEHRKSSRSKPGALPNQIFPLLFAFAGKLKEARDVVFRPRGTRRRRTGETDRREKKEIKARSNGKQGRRGRKGNASVGKDDRLDQAGRRERRRLPKLDALSGAAAGCLVS